MNDKPLLRCLNLTHVYQEEKHKVQVLTAVNFVLHDGEMLAISGRSGSGKSTLLHLLGTLDKPQQGQIFFQDENILNWSETRACQFRNQQLGFVYQFHHLLGEFNALENVAMPLLIAGQSMKQANEKAYHFLAKVGLQDRCQHRPSALSGGERQRVAIARALVNTPRLILADEPTGNLDRRCAQDIYQRLRDLNQELGVACIVVTHDTELAKQFDRRLILTDGQLAGV